MAIQVPVTLGNIVGGVVFVALVNYAQVVGAGRDIERVEHRKRVREVREARMGRGRPAGAAPRSRRSLEEGE